MNNYSKIINQMKEKITNFSIKISEGLSRPNSKFVLDMSYGLISSSSSFLSEIARSLKENITLKKVIERLSNHLANFDEDNRKLVWDNYINSVKEKIDEDTGEFINGYKMIEVAGLTKNEQLPIPVYSRLFSSNEEKFVSENEEYLNALKYINKTFGDKGTYALDRGFDDEKYFKYFSNTNLKFVIRMKTINIKPNYSELSKIYKLDRRTIKKYNNGYSKSEVKRNRKSKLDKYYDEIKEKLGLPGITITGLL